MEYYSAIKRNDVLLPENWVHLLVGVEAKDTTKTKTGRRKGLL